MLIDLSLYHRYHSLAPMYYRGAQAAIVVYDIQNQDSFQRAKTWVKELHKQVSESYLEIEILYHLERLPAISWVLSLTSICRFKLIFFLGLY